MGWGRHNLRDGPASRPDTWGRRPVLAGPRGGHIVRTRTSRGLRLFVLAAAVVALAAGCGSSSGSSSGGGGGGGNSDATIIMGTTDTAIHFDPANAYDLHSWNVIYNVYDELMTIP